MIKPDHWILRKSTSPSSPLVAPFDEDLLNPSSLDVRLAGVIYRENPAAYLNRWFPGCFSQWRSPQTLEGTTPESPLWLAPGEFVLASTLEIFNIPDHTAAEFKLKSSRAREGYDNALAVWADPGWSGSALTLELRNCNRFNSLPLYQGLKIGQMIFHTMESLPITSYRDRGRYNGDRTAQPSRG
jgi:dCTP deaminase